MSLRIFSTAARHWSTCGRFEAPHDRVLYAYGRLLRRVSWPLPARDAVVRVRLRGHESPFYLRLSSTDWLVLEEIFHQGEYAFVGDHIRNARSIVDLGANAGFTVRYWHRLFPWASMIAVEPDPSNCQTCRQNISAAGISARVTLVQAGVGARPGRAELVNAGGEWAYQVHAGDGGRGIPVQIYRLEDILERYAPGRTIDLLKCDIEGGERELFAECGPWIERVKAIVIELHPPYGLSDLQSDLARANAPFVVAECSTKKSCPVVLLERDRNCGESRAKGEARLAANADALH